MPMIAPALTSPERQTGPVAGWFFDEVPALACLIGSDGRLLRVNGAWSDLLGHSVPAVVGKPFANFFHAEEIPLLEAGLTRCGPQEAWDRFEARFRCGDGSYKWLLWQFKADDEHKLVSAAAVDISARKQEEVVARRRLAAASVQSQVWSSLAEGCSTHQALILWAGLLQRHLEAREVRIWTLGQPQGGPVLQAQAAPPSAAGEPLAELDFLEQDIRQVLASRTPRVIPDVNREPRLALHQQLFRERQIKGILLHPVLAGEQVIAAIGVFVSTDGGANAATLIETAAREMGAALTRLSTEEELRATRRAYDALLRSATVGVCCLDAERNVKAWNRAAERILGWRSADIVTRRFPIAGAAEQGLFQTCADGAFAGESTSRIETKCWSSNGKPVEVALSIAPLAKVGEGVTQALVVIEDLTDRKRAERRLRLQNAMTGLFVGSQSIEKAMGAVFATLGSEFGWECGEFWRLGLPGDAPQRTVNWHSAAPNAAQFTAESRNRPASAEAELLSQIVREGKPRRIAGYARDRNFARCDLAARHGFDDAIGIPIGTGQGASGVLLFFASAIDECDDQFLALMTAISVQIGQFLTRCQLEESLREAEENLLQAKKMDAIGRLVGGVVHDFNNVLTVILGCGEIVLEESGGNESSRELLAEVINAGKRAAGLTRQLLAFCRKEVAEPDVLDLNELVVEMEKMLRRLIGADIELETVLTPDPSRLSGDPGHIEQIVMNLAVNARDAMPQGGRLVIATENVDFNPARLKNFPRAMPGRYVLLSVSDTGCGMDEATRNRIFEPFFTTKPAGKGTGMGLATVCELVREAGSQIAVESELAKGTTFRILFPAVAQGLTSWQVDSAPAAVPRGNETVIVVEDDANVRRLIGRILKAQGYTVLDAGGAQEAIELCRRRSPKLDLLITDVVMPKMSGPELAKHLKTLYSNLKVLFVSGYGESERRGSAALNREEPFLQKPFTTYDLARKVRDVCDS